MGLNIPYGYTDSYGKRKLKKYNVVEEALTAMKKYCDEHGIGIIELFSRFDEDGSMSVTHEEFKQGLRVRTTIVNTTAKIKIRSRSTFPIIPQEIFSILT